MFLHPWAVLLGVGAAALPVVVHLLTRPRPVRMPLSTLRFVRQAIRQRRARHRLRDLIVLLLRMAAVLLIALAIARPRVGQRPLVSESQAGATTRVVVLDVSQSMAAVDRGVTAIERARTTAATFLRYRPGLRANLIIAGAQPRSVFTEPSHNFEALRDGLLQAAVRPERLDVSRAIRAAAEMLAPGSPNDQARRELVVISDFQRANWARADFRPLPSGTNIQFESISLAGELANVALLDVRVEGRASSGSVARLQVEVGNFSPAARRVMVDVTLGSATYRLAGNCPANRRTLLSEEVTFEQSGWRIGQARLVGIDDALAADNVRDLVVPVRGKPLYALITRQSANRKPSSSYYLQCSLVPDARLGDTASARVARVSASSMDDERLRDSDLIVIDHPGIISADDIKMLAGLMRRGRPVIYVAGESVDATNLRRLTSAVGSGLRMPVEFAPPAKGQRRRDLFLGFVRKEAVPFRVFGEHTDAIVSQLRFSGGLVSRRVENALEDDVAATYGDGTAFLVLTATDTGALAVLNADLNRSNLPATAAFVPLMDALLCWALDRNLSRSIGTCGEPLVARLPIEAGVSAGLRVTAARGGDVAMGTELGELVDEGVGVVWRWNAPTRPGVYEVKRDGKTVFALPAVVPAEESQLTALSADVLRDRLATGRSVHYHAIGDDAQRADTLWTWLAAICVLCIVSEVAALALFRS